MRLRTVLSILVAVNVLWAAAFIGYVQRSTAPVVKPGAPSGRTLSVTTNSPAIARPATQNVAASASTAPSSNNALAAADRTVPPAMTNVIRSLRQFGWQDVTNEIYAHYLANLRAVGCPEKQVRGIVVADVSELFDKRRLDRAIKTDAQWWKAETFMGMLPMQNMAGASFDEERRDLLNQLLGEGWEDTIKLPSLNGSAVDLTGPVLGALPAETWNDVQEICARSMERHQAYLNARINAGGGGMDNIEVARMREQTRSDLAKILTPGQLEEFLLRYSHNASQLRQDMRGLDLTPDEFRKIFRALDPAEHQMQLDYGGPEALSQKQREQLEAQRDRAIKEALSPPRYEQYLATKDPLYRQAQTMATQYGMNGKAVQPLYQMQKAIETKRLHIAQNATMTAEQRAQALQSLGLEQQQLLQRMLGDATYRQ